MKIKQTMIATALLLAGTAALAEVTVRNEVKVKPVAASAESLAAAAQGGADACVHFSPLCNIQGRFCKRCEERPGVVRSAVLRQLAAYAEKNYNYPKAD